MKRRLTSCPRWRPRFAAGVVVSLAMNLTCHLARADDTIPTARTITLQQEWIPFSGFAGEVVAAADFGPRKGLFIKILSGGETIDPIKAVLSGQADFGVVAGDLLIQAVQKGAPLIAVGVINDVSPTCFVSRKSLHIDKPADFVGRRVGVLPGTNTEKIYKLLLNKSHVNESSIHEVDVPFDLATFIAGSYDVRPAFEYDEPVTLSRANIPITILRPVEFGVHFLGTVYFTRRSTVQNDATEVAAFVDALIDGWKSVASPGGIPRAISELKKMFPEINAARETASLRLGLPYFTGPRGTLKPLYSADSSWVTTIEGLVELGSIPRSGLPLKAVWDSSFVTRAYSRKITP